MTAAGGAGPQPLGRGRAAQFSVRLRHRDPGAATRPQHRVRSLLRNVAQYLAGLGRKDTEDLGKGVHRDATVVSVGVVGVFWHRVFLRAGSIRGLSGRLGLSYPG
jgi:hypothetical protein